MTLIDRGTSYFYTMQHLSPTRGLHRHTASLAVATVCLSFPMAFAAQAPAANPAKPSAAIPATQPTQGISAPAAYTPPPQPQQHPAKVTYSNSQLTISADNSSLNQILREIARQTSIKITGGVTDERVFGQYGPATPAEILAALLDGTGSNMLLIAGQGSTPAELILSPRHGGPTPPNPNAIVVEEREQREREEEERRTSAPPQPQPQPSSPGPQAASPNSPANGAPANPASPDAGAASPTDQQSPNGVKTPQQIFDQLQKLRQQQQQTNPQ